MIGLFVAFFSSFGLTSAGDAGTTFFIVGDYGVVTNLTQAIQVFDAIDEVVGQAEPKSISDAEFFVTVGDNIYPELEDAPTDEEFAEMVGLFNGPNIANLPVWAIRGNHDAYFDWTDELVLSMEQKQWMLPSLWYSKLVPSGKDGELLGLLFVDSVLMVCSNYTSFNVSAVGAHDSEMKKLLAKIVCTDQLVEWGNTQYDFIKMTMQEWASNDKIIWRASIQHYPVWFLNLDETAYAPINDVYLPLLRQYNFDLYLNGHEHLIAYAYLDNSTPLSNNYPRNLQSSENCASGIEYFFNDTSHSRVTKFRQGEALHQITTGCTGKVDYPICYDRQQNLATFTYA